MADPLHVLYVDDETDLLEIGKLFLEESGEFFVTTVGSASAALELLHNEKFDAIISDYQMPGLDGIQLLNEVREKYGSIPFILFTGRGREEVVIQAINSGADFYLQKGGELKSQFAELSHKIKQAAFRNRAEDVIRDAREYSEKLIQTANAMIIGLNNNGEIILFNPAAEQITGYTSAEMVGRNWFEVIVPKMRYPRVWEEFNRLLTGGLPEHFENPILTKSGEERYIAWKNSEIRDNGEIVGIIAFGIDITERKQAEQELRAAFERLKETHLLAHIGTWDWVIETDTVTWSEELCNIAGWDPSLPAPTYAEFPRIHTPASWNLLNDAVTRALTTGEPYNLELEMIRPDGSIRWTNAFGGIERNGNGKIIGLHGTVQDITGSKQVEVALRESEEKYHTVADFTFDWEFWIAPDGKFIYVSPSCERITGYRPEEFIQNPDLFTGIVHCDDRDRIIDHLLHKESTICEMGTLEFRIISRSGEERWIGHECQPVYGRNGEYRGNRGSNRDITGRKRAEVALRESEVRFREQYQNNPLAIFTWQHRAGDFVLVGFNRAAETLTRGRVKDYLGKFASDLYSSRPEILSEVRQCFSGQTTISKKLISEHFLPGRFIKTTATFAPPDMIMVHMEDITERKKVREALIKSQSQLAEALDLAHMANWEFDVATGVFTFDDRFYALYGTTGKDEGGNQMPADVYAKKFVHPDDQYMVADEVKKAIQATDPGYLSEVEHRIVRRDGEIRNIVVRFGITKDSEGRTISTHGANQDITERKRAEEALQESEGKFRSLVEHALEGTVILDLEGTILFANNAAARTLEIDDWAGLIGRNVMEFITPESLEDVVRDFRNVSQGHDAYLAQYSAISVKGNKFYVESIGKIISYEGKPAILLSIRDITDRKRADEALRESEEKYRTLFDNAGDVIFIHDTNGRILAFNTLACERLGYTYPELMSMTVNQMDSPGDAQLVVERIARLMEHAHLSFETVHRRKDGSLIPTTVSARLISWEGQPAVMSICHDITERKRAEEEVRKANEKLNLLSGITRHDINNQLTLLMGFLSIMESRQHDPTLNEYFHKVTNAAKRISAMIQFTKEYEEIGVNAPAWQDCPLLVDRAAKQATLGKVMMKNDLPPGIHVFADPLVVKVFYNLIDNAVRYGGKITTIRFSVVEHGNDRLIICEDDGEGIPAEQKMKIFERGFGKNTGMGLFLSKEILDITGITITENGEPGKGARFEIFIPGSDWRQAANGD